MEPTDKQLKEQLARGPLARHGFNERLRERIENEIARGGARSGSRLLGRLYRYGAVTALMAAVLIGVWQWGIPLISGDNKQAAHSQKGLEQMNQLDAAVTTEPPRSALVIGTRTDSKFGSQGATVSAYRTILVVPESAGLTVAAEGPGLYMPYKQSFWKIDASTEEATGWQQLEAVKLTPGRQPQKQEAKETEGLSEKLLFAGNNYVSILQTASIPGDSGKSGTYAWVKNFDQLLSSRSGQPFDPDKEPHVKLGEWLGSGGTEEQWAIVRREGQWKPEKPASGKGAADLAKWQPLGVALPELIVSYDALGLTWDQIRQFDPDAIDAFTSPTDDLLVAVSKEKIVIYPFRQADPASKALTLPLSNGESIVMVQWGMNSYIPRWKEWLSDWIPPASTP